MLQLWFVYNSVRLDVAVLPEYGAKWAAGIRAKHARRLRRRASRAALAAFAAGQGRRRRLHDLRVRLVRHGVGLLHDAVTALPADHVRVDRVHGRLGEHDHGAVAAVHVVAQPPGRRRTWSPMDQLLGSGQARLRLHRVLRLHQLQPVPGDLVRQHAGRDALLPPAPDRACGSTVTLLVPIFVFVLPFFG